MRLRFVIASFPLRLTFFLLAFSPFKLFLPILLTFSFFLIINVQPIYLLLDILLFLLPLSAVLLSNGPHHLNRVELVEHLFADVVSGFSPELYILLGVWPQIRVEVVLLYSISVALGLLTSNFLELFEGGVPPVDQNASIGGELQEFADGEVMCL